MAIWGYWDTHLLSLRGNTVTLYWLGFLELPLPTHWGAIRILCSAGHHKHYIQMLGNQWVRKCMLSKISPLFALTHWFNKHNSKTKDLRI